MGSKIGIFLKKRIELENITDLKNQTMLIKRRND